MKYYFIINPNSGKIDTNQFEQRILKECSKEKIKYISFNKSDDDYIYGIRNWFFIYKK